MPEKIKVMGIQFTPEIGDKIGNLKKVGKLLNEYSWYNPDLIVLPEVFNSGVGHGKMQELAEPIPNDQTTMFLSGFAERMQANIVGGSYIEKCPDGEYRNACVVFDRSGKIIAKYHKIHMFSYYGSREGEFISKGNSVVIAETDVGKIGLSICYDLRFPELYRTLTYSGAEIIVCPAAWPYPRLEHWNTLNKARAIENQAYFISVNQVGQACEGRTNLGHSMIINPWGDVIASAGGTEGVMMAEIDLGLVRKIREEFPVLNDRDIDAYKLIS